MKTKVIEIPFHAVDAHERFSNAITCLSHALEAVDGAENVDPILARNLYEKIGEALHYGELVEKVSFGNEWDVVNKGKE